MQFMLTLDQAGGYHAAGGFHPLAAADRRQPGTNETGEKPVSQIQSSQLRRLTKRLVAKLKADEAVVAGSNANFDLLAAGHRAQNFYMLGSMGLACPIALGVAIAQPNAASSRSRAMARS